MKRSSSFAGMLVSNAGEAVVDAGSVRGGSRGKNVPDGSKVRFSSAFGDPYSEPFSPCLLYVGTVLCVRNLLCVRSFFCVRSFLCVRNLLYAPTPLACSKYPT
jgi:hypothetical protein